MTLLLENRASAGRELARALAHYRNRSDVLLLAIPRGGVPVAEVIAHELQAPLDVMVVRKLRVPGTSGPVGAVAPERVRVLDWGLVSAENISDDEIDYLTLDAEAKVELLAAAYRGQRLYPDIQGRTVILVDDGITSGASIRAAIAAVRLQHPARVIVAAPVAPFEVLTGLRKEVEEVAYLSTPYPVVPVSRSYWEYPELTSQDVREVLARCWHAEEERACRTENVALEQKGEALRGAKRGSRRGKPATAARPNVLRTAMH